jgi:hypothetical protein
VQRFQIVRLVQCKGQPSVVRHESTYPLREIFEAWIEVLHFVAFNGILTSELLKQYNKYFSVTQQYWFSTALHPFPIIL